LLRGFGLPATESIVFLPGPARYDEPVPLALLVALTLGSLAAAALAVAYALVHA